MNQPDATTGIVVDNLSAPIKLTGVHVDGVAAEHAKHGDMLKVFTRHTITSEDPAFHRIAQGLADLIAHHTQVAGSPVDIRNADIVLLVIHPDKTAELWADTPAVAIKILAKRDIAPGTPIFEDDIADLVEMAFPCVEIGAEDQVICLFRIGWLFGLHFNFNPGKNLSVDDLNRTLGTLYRALKYRHVYKAIEIEAVAAALTRAGWFPFAEIATSRDFADLVHASETGADIGPIEEKILASLDEVRLERMLNRWLAKPHLASRETLLRSAVKNYVSGDPVPVIKIVLTEIEGVLNAARRATLGSGAKLSTLLEFASETGERKAGGPYTLLLPREFATFLRERTFVNFDPIAGEGDASSRHAVGHGEAKPETYTELRALQAILTLDQLAFFM